MVLAHARALLTGTDEGRTAYIDADLLNPQRILDEAARTLDFDRPIGLILFSILGHLPDLDDVKVVLAELVDGLPTASYLAIADATWETQAQRSFQTTANHAG